MKRIPNPCSSVLSVSIDFLLRFLSRRPRFFGCGYAALCSSVAHALLMPVRTRPPPSPHRIPATLKNCRPPSPSQHRAVGRVCPGSLSPGSSLSQSGQSQNRTRRDPIAICLAKLRLRAHPANGATSARYPQVGLSPVICPQSPVPGHHLSGPSPVERRALSHPQCPKKSGNRLNPLNNLAPTRPTHPIPAWSPLSRRALHA